MLVLSRRIAWYATWPTYVSMWPSRVLDLRSNIDLFVWGHQVRKCFDAPWREKYDGGRIKQLAFLFRKVFANNFFAQKASFDVFLPPAPVSALWKPDSPFFLSFSHRRKPFFAKKVFLTFLPPTPKLLFLVKIWWHVSKSTAQELSNATSPPFRRSFAVLVCHFRLTKHSFYFFYDASK